MTYFGEKLQDGPWLWALRNKNALVYEDFACGTFGFLSRFRSIRWTNLYSFLIDGLFAVLPQPVYMNMGDLAQMAAARARSSPAIIDEGQEDEEESPELKTPTADNQHVSMIPGAAASNQAVATTKVI